MSHLGRRGGRTARRVSLGLGLLLIGCSSMPGPVDAGADAGFVFPPLDGGCVPAAGAGEECTSLDAFPSCARTEARHRQNQCDLRTVRPDAVATFVCDEGIEWRDTFSGTSPTNTCSYAADGTLIGARADTPSSRLVAGYWQFSTRCTQTELCPVRDAGSCLPVVTAYQECREDLGTLDFCAPREADHQPAFCGASSYALLVSNCTGGRKYVDVRSGIGPSLSCVYADGGLVGGGWSDDTNRAVVWGRWALEDCVPVEGCACQPIAPAGKSCVLDAGSVTFCAPTEAGQRAAVCAPDAGTVSRFACAEGSRWVQRLDSMYRLECTYADGGLLGGSVSDDLDRGQVYGRWTVTDCTAVDPACP